MRRVVALMLLAIAGLLAAEKVRQPAVAGAFYPADPKELGKMLDGFLAKATVPQIKDVVAVVSPHAGYVYSGPVAAYSYAVLKGRKFERVVVIAPSHVEAFSFASVYDGTAYATPFGKIPVDQVFAQKLVRMSPRIQLSTRGHAPVGDRGEHALEVQLPFLQRVLGDFKLVPIVMGDQSYESCRAVGLSLAKLMQTPGTLIVASSDLSHYHPYDDAVKRDHKTLKAIEEYDYLSMARNFEARVWEACGGGPIVAAMIAAERLGATQARVLKYANSGDTTGERSNGVVGYGSVVITRDPIQNAAAGSQFSLTPAERAELLKIAKKSVETAVKEKKLYEYSGQGFDSLMQERGAFVTLKKKGELRGCIGYVAPMKPLCLTVRDVAALAAVRDTRFPPVAPSELGELQYEISVLSPLRHVLDIKQIHVGLHGLVIKRQDAEGLLLPQVPVEQHWDRMTFLEQLCRKAGLPPGTWKDPEADLFEFTALVFGEPKAQPAPRALRLPPPSAVLFSESRIPESGTR
jgi:AmmeMemoRadiSam system protein B/AmmeMemoRadiSam system protein A